jgi:predicted TIM-barrel enzyme
MTNVSIPVVNMLKNSWTLAVSVAVNISMKLCFVSVNGPRETYFADEPRTSCSNLWDEKQFKFKNTYNQK